jgi:hypothetical protein
LTVTNLGRIVPAGIVNRITDGLAAAVPAPHWLADLAWKAPNGNGESHVSHAGDTDTAGNGAARWRELARGASEGARNDSATRLAGYLLRRGVDPIVALELLQGWNMRDSPPLSESEIARTLDSICAKEARRRGAHE